MKIRKHIMLALPVILITLAVLITGCGLTGTTDKATTQAEDIGPQDAFELIQENRNNADFVVLDVRTVAEYNEGHLENVINIDYYGDTFSDEINALDKNKTYLVYCRSGVRSAGAVEIMKGLGFRQVYNMTGGIIQWQQDGLPIVE